VLVLKTNIQAMTKQVYKIFVYRKKPKIAMKISIIKQLVETYNLQQLTAADAALAEGETPPIHIAGEDEGQQLTHAYAAMFIRQMIDEKGVNAQTALREYAKMVREAIS
jgi:hypothetical protein